MSRKSISLMLVVLWSLAMLAGCEKDQRILGPELESNEREERRRGDEADLPHDPEPSAAGELGYKPAPVDVTFDAKGGKGGGGGGGGGGGSDGGGGGSASAATLTHRDIYRYETSADHRDYLNSGISSGGEVYTTDYSIAEAVLIRDVEDGDQISWRFYRPDGTLDTSLSVSYDGASGCWSNGYCFSGDMYWYGLARIQGDMTGTWTVEVYLNDILEIIENFEMVGYTLELSSVAADKGLADTVVPDALRVRLLDFDGETPVAGETVRFAFGEVPKNSGDPGFYAEFVEVADGSQSSSMSATTDENGYAEVFVALGSADGVYNVEATQHYAQEEAVTAAFDATELTLAVVAMRANRVNIKDKPEQFYEAEFVDGVVTESVNEPFGGMPYYYTDVEIDIDADPYLPPWDFEVVWSWSYDGALTEQGSFNGISATIQLLPPVSPVANDDYGVRVSDFLFEFYPVVEKGNPKMISQQEISSYLWLFFELEADDDNDTVPNWAEYWAQVDEIIALEYDETLQAMIATLGDNEGETGINVDFRLLNLKNHTHFYDGSATDLHGYTYCGRSDVWIGPWAAGVNSFTGHEGIDTYAETILHEHTHMVSCYLWFGPGMDGSMSPELDSDGDNVLDSHEIALGAEQGWTAEESLIYITEESLPLEAELFWAEGAAAHNDWANPGSQTED